MEILIIAVIVVVVGFIIYTNRSNGLDVNKDGKITAADAEAAVKHAVETAKSKADVNKDGKVDAADVKAAATKVKTRAKKAVSKVKDAAKKPAGRKPKAK